MHLVDGVADAQNTLGRRRHIANAELHVLDGLPAEAEGVGGVVAGGARAVNIGYIKCIVDELICRRVVGAVRARVAALVALLRAQPRVDCVHPQVTTTRVDVQAKGLLGRP